MDELTEEKTLDKDIIVIYQQITGFIKKKMIENKQAENNKSSMKQNI
jgi:hypothetical protein